MFTYKTYIVEWITEVYSVDQYGFRNQKATIYYEKAFSTPEEARKHLEEIVVPNDNKYAPKVLKDTSIVDSTYYSVGVRYRERMIDTYQK